MPFRIHIWRSYLLLALKLIVPASEGWSSWFKIPVRTRLSSPAVHPTSSNSVLLTDYLGSNIINEQFLSSFQSLVEIITRFQIIYCARNDCLKVYFVWLRFVSCDVSHSCVVKQEFLCIFCPNRQYMHAHTHVDQPTCHFNCVACKSELKVVHRINHLSINNSSSTLILVKST